MSNNKYINEDTYQTLQEVSIETQSDYEKAIEPLWKEQQDEFKNFEVFVATPVHSDVSIHFTQALIEFQKDCFYKKLKVSFHLVKSSLVTQGRNLSVAGFLESKATHLLFIDSDIYFHAESIIKMIDRDKDILSIPYPLKTMMWDKVMDRINNNEIKTINDLKKSFNTYPMRVADDNDIKVNKGVMEVTHSPTGCMLIKRSVFDKMIEKYPDKNIVQKTVINGEYVDRPNLWNFFDCIHDPKTKTYLGEDFSFCKLWKDIGGKCYVYINDPIIHVGEHQYEGCFRDELKLSE